MNKTRTEIRIATQNLSATMEMASQLAALDEFPVELGTDRNWLGQDVVVVSLTTMLYAEDEIADEFEERFTEAFPGSHRSFVIF